MKRVLKFRKCLIRNMWRVTHGGVVLQSIGLVEVIAGWGEAVDHLRLLIVRHRRVGSLVLRFVLDRELLHKNIQI